MLCTVYKKDRTTDQWIGEVPRDQCRPFNDVVDNCCPRLSELLSGYQQRIDRHRDSRAGRTAVTSDSASVKYSDS